MTHPIIHLLKTVEHLHGPDGCPWDKEQTHESLRRCLKEESQEVLEAIDNNDDANLCEELGDLLLQVLMHSQIAKKRGAFDFAAVAKGLDEKLIRRHPHVFGGEKALTGDEALARWNAIKAEEKKAKMIKPF